MKLIDLLELKKNKCETTFPSHSTIQYFLVLTRVKLLCFIQMHLLKFDIAILLE